VEKKKRKRGRSGNEEKMEQRDRAHVTKRGEMDYLAGKK
jgi:hypothetical protein